jgi:hypothetical protein
VALLALSILLGYLTLRFGRTSDEYDNFLGGCLIAQGQVIYLDFFSNHHPFHYYLLGGLYNWFGCDLVLPRFLTLGLVTGTFLLAYYVSGNISNLVGMLLYHLFAPIYRGQFYLAEVFLGLGLIILLNTTLAPRCDLNRRGLFVAQFIGHFMVVNSNVSGAFFSGLFLLYSTARARRLTWEHAAFLLSFLPMFAIMLAQGNAREFFDQAISFNLNVYSKYIGTSLINPIDVMNAAYRFVAYRLENIIFVVDRWEGRWYQHVQELVLLATVLAYILFFRQRRALDLGFLLLLGLLSLNRPVEHRTLPFVALALFAITMLLRSGSARRWRLVRVGYAVWLLAFAAWTYAWFAPSDRSDYFSLQINRLSSGSDRYLQQFTDPGEKVLFYSYDPLAYLTGDRQPGSFYYFFFPWQAELPGVQERIIRDIEDNGVKLVAFDTHDRGLLQYGAKVYEHLGSHFKVVDGWDEGEGRIFVRRGGSPGSEVAAAWAYSRKSQPVLSDQETRLPFDVGRMIVDGARVGLAEGSRLTVPRTGKYLIVANVTFSGSPEGERRVRIRQNGDRIIGEREVRPRGNGNTGMSVAALASLAAQDYLELEVFQTSSQSLNVHSVSEERPALTMLSIDPRASSVDDLPRAVGAATRGAYEAAYQEGAWPLTPERETTLTFTDAGVDGEDTLDAADAVSASRLRVRTPGSYLVTGRLTFEPKDRASGEWREILIVANGSRVIGRQTLAVSGGARTDLAVTALVELAAEEYVELRTMVGSRGAVQVRASSSERPALTLVRVG